MCWVRNDFRKPRIYNYMKLSVNENGLDWDYLMIIMIMGATCQPLLCWCLIVSWKSSFHTLAGALQWINEISSGVIWNFPMLAVCAHDTRAPSSGAVQIEHKRPKKSIFSFRVIDKFKIGHNAETRPRLLIFEACYKKTKVLEDMIDWKRRQT